MPNQVISIRPLAHNITSKVCRGPNPVSVYMATSTQEKIILSVSRVTFTEPGDLDGSRSVNSGEILGGPASNRPNDLARDDESASVNVKLPSEFTKTLL